MCFVFAGDSWRKNGKDRYRRPMKLVDLPSRHVATDKENLGFSQSYTSNHSSTPMHLDHVQPTRSRCVTQMLSKLAVLHSVCAATLRALGNPTDSSGHCPPVDFLASGALLTAVLSWGTMHFALRPSFSTHCSHATKLLLSTN